jgi:hypothetical protein
MTKEVVAYEIPKKQIMNGRSLGFSGTLNSAHGC